MLDEVVLKNIFIFIYRSSKEAKADKLRQEMQQQMGAKMEAKVRKVEERLTPAEAIPARRLAALQARIESLHAGGLLADEEVHALEDVVADFVELESTMSMVATLEAIRSNENASKLLKLVGLSERITADGAFARQARRKYV